MMCEQDNPQDIIKTTWGYASILRRHAAEANRAAQSDKPDQHTATREGWEVLCDQLSEAAGILEWFADERADIHNLPRPSSEPISLDKTG